MRRRYGTQFVEAWLCGKETEMYVKTDPFTEKDKIPCAAGRSDPMSVDASNPMDLMFVGGTNSTESRSFVD